MSTGGPVVLERGAEASWKHALGWEDRPRGGAVAASARPPAGLVAYDDMSAVAALRAAHQAGWRVPEDLSVVGIDDIQFAAYTNPALTTVAQPKQELGPLAVDALLAPAPGAAPQARILDGPLIVRESTAPPGGVVS